MTSIIEKRQSLHKSLATQQQENDVLKLQLSQLQALANIGIATSMIAHEINNLLTGLGNYAALSLENPDDKALTEKTLQKTAKNCRCAADVMQSILAVANGETREKKNNQLLTLVKEIFNCLCRDFSKDGIKVKIEIPEGLEVLAVPVEIQQVLMNLILNARDAMLERGGTLTIKAHQIKDAIHIEVSDTGCGINQDVIGKIFQPFFSTKNKNIRLENSGSGLGLPFCRKVVESYGGTILVESQPSNGTTFTLELPKTQ